MTSYDDVCRSWIDIQQGLDVKARQTPRVWFDGHRIFSYGTHFEMARALKDKKGDLRLFLINGEVWGSISTSNHQSHVRSAIRRSGVRSVIIPYGAIDAAGIDRDSIEVVQRSNDTWDEKLHVFTEEQPEWRWRLEPWTESVDYTMEELTILANQHHLQERDKWLDQLEYARKDSRDDWYYENLLATEPKQLTAEEWRDNNPWSRTSQTVRIGSRWVLYRNGFFNSVVDYDHDEDGPSYSYTTSRHWLGESLIRAKVTWIQVLRCKTCRKHPGRAYGPALEENRYVRWDYQTRESIYELTGQEDPDQLPRCPDCDNRNGVTGYRDRHRWAYFLSGFDRNEPRRSYFLCELPPKTTPTTIEEAYEALKPDVVKLAEQMGREVARQGDIFAVPLVGVTKRALRTQGASFEKRGNLLGTNHVATEVARMPDGTTLARGVLTHAPARRAPDHVRVRIGNAFHVVVKNTVPLAA
jgi:hypothetical protein